MTRADIEPIGKQDIRRRYVGKQAPRTSQKKLSAALVVGGRELMKLESGHNEKERLLLQAEKGEMAKRRQGAYEVKGTYPSEFRSSVRME